MQDTSANNKRIAKNTLMLYIRMFFWLVVSLYTSRVVLRTLGVIDFGIYNVVAGFVSLFGFLNGTLSSSIQRFYNTEKANNGIIGVNKIYSLGFIIHFFFAIALFVVLETFGIWYINNIMVIPAERMMAANFVFQAVVVSMSLTIFQIPYLGLVIAYEYMDYYAIVSIIDVVLKLLIILVLPFVGTDKLIFYSILLLLVSVLDFILYYIFVKRKIFGLQLQIKANKKAEFKGFMSFVSWNLYGTLIYSLKGQGVNILLNGYFGPVINAARGIAIQIHSASNTFSTSITTAFRPQIVEAYSRAEDNRVKFLFFSEIRICYAMILFIVVPLIFEMNQILVLWLGNNVPDYTGLFSILVLIDLLFGVFNQPIVQVAFAVGNIRNFQIANSIVNMLLLPLCWFFLSLGYSAASSFVITIFVNICNQIVCFYALSKMYSAIKSKEFLGKVLFPCFFATLLTATPQLILHYMVPEGFMRFVVTCLVHVIVTTITIYYVILKDRERKIVKEKVFQIAKKL